MISLKMLFERKLCLIGSTHVEGKIMSKTQLVMLAPIIM